MRCRRRGPGVADEVPSLILSSAAASELTEVWVFEIGSVCADVVSLWNEPNSILEL
jgi:hypothetical protein